MGKVLLESTVEIEDRKSPTWRSRTGEPTVWVSVNGKQLLLNGTPATGYVVVGYIQQPTAMASDAATPDARIPATLHPYLKYAAATYLLTLAGQGQDLARASDMFARFMAGLGLGPLPLANTTVKR
jgi:hypothetical protein